jgi:DNA-binding CsgD family transcriptional regulator
MKMQHTLRGAGTVNGETRSGIADDAAPAPWDCATSTALRDSGLCERTVSPEECPLEPIFQAQLDVTRCAAFVCDASARVLGCNAEAVALLRVADGIALRRSRISIADVAARLRLRAILERTCLDSALLVPRPSRQPSYQAVLKSVAFRDAAASPLSDVWTIVVADPARVTAEHLRAIARLYALTPAETRLAEQLMLGATPEEAAGAMRLSVCTVRSQLSSLLRKTGARRQAELVRFFSAVPA